MGSTTFDQEQEEQQEEIKADAGQRRAQVALQAFFRLAEVWQLTNAEAQIVLGQPAKTTFFRWKRGDVSGLPHDTLLRISYLLGVYQALQIHYPSAERADAWLRKPNRAFAGQTPIARMLGGDVTDLAAVRQYLDAALEVVS